MRRLSVQLRPIPPFVVTIDGESGRLKYSVVTHSLVAVAVMRVHNGNPTPRHYFNFGEFTPSEPLEHSG